MNYDENDFQGKSKPVNNVLVETIQYELNVLDGIRRKNGWTKEQAESYTRQSRNIKSYLGTLEPITPLFT